MWLRAWLAISVSTVLSQHTHTRVKQGDSSFEWGWQQNPEQGSSVGHYYVKLPQSEQRVQYSADASGYHGAVAINASDDTHVHTANFALGQTALDLSNQAPLPYTPNATQLLPQVVQGNTGPVEIYLLQQQFSSPSLFNDQLYQIAPNYSPSNIVEYTPNYYYNNAPNPIPTQVNLNVHTQHNQRNDGQYQLVRDETPTAKETRNDYRYDPKTVVSVFKDHNCTEDAKSSNVQTTKLIPQYTTNVNGNFGAKENKKPVTYKTAVNFKVEPQKSNARSERYYYTSYTTEKNINQNINDGISRLVASTQDLISNEDLLRINHAAEKHVKEPLDDIFKPRPRFSLKAQETKYIQSTPQTIFQDDVPRSRITVKAKIGNIVDTQIEHVENNAAKEQILQTSANEYKFASPIVVQDSSYNDYKEQIVNNLVSTMVPYIQDGYEIVGVSDGSNYTNQNDLVNVTPRPVSQKYLAPITVALRLINANDTESLNTIDDHETADSEFIPESVKPQSERTLVEIQESVPISITHINDVEVHEYMEEGRANKSPLDYAKALYNQYMEGTKKNFNNALKKYANNFEKSKDEDHVQSGSDIQTEVEVRPNEDENDRREYIRDVYDYNGSESQKIIQPIIIEKEVPITQYVDRYIEKQVPYPERVNVEVPVDRPVAVPIPYEKIVEKPVEVTKYVDKPYPVEVPRPYPVEIRVPYPVEQKVYIDRPVHVPYPIEKLVEKEIIHQVPVPTPVAVPVEVPHQVLYPVPVRQPVPVPVEVEKRVPVEKIVTQQVPVPVTVERKVPYPVPYETKVPVPYAVEKRIPVPVDRIVEKPVTITKYVEKPIHIEVPVPQPVPVAVHVPHPYPVDRIVEKKIPVPVPVDRIVEKKVPIQVPYPVEKIVEKIVEKPVVVTKYVDKPYPVEKRVPYPVEKRVPYPVEKIVEKKVPYAVHVPFEVKVPYPVEKIVEKPIPVPYKAYAERHLAYNTLASDSQQQPQYIKYQEQKYPQYEKQAQYSRNQYDQYYNNLHNLRNPRQKPVQTTHWGNLYASSYQHINNTDKKIPSIANYIDYVTNRNQQVYYGPPPVEQYSDWDQNKNYEELKVRRTDRMPKISTVNIEYGGFRPPLIPSTEVDLDGMPVNKSE